VHVQQLSTAIFLQSEYKYTLWLVTIYRMAQKPQQNHQ